MINSILDTIELFNHKFIDSPFKEWSATPAAMKGTIGRKIVIKLLTAAGYNARPTGCRTVNLTIDGEQVEVKTGFMRRKNDLFNFYGYDPTGSTKYWILQFVFPEKIVLVKMTRQTMANVHLGRTRKNAMLSTTLEQILADGGVILTEYNTGE